MRKNEQGSVSVEAVLSISIVLILLITLFGTLLSVYIEEECHWVALQAIEDMGIYSMPFMGHARIIQEEVNGIILSQLTGMALNRHVETHGLKTLVSVHPETAVDFGDYGFAELTFTVQFNLLTLDSVKTIVLPMSASVFSDGNNFADNLVFITTYGEKYHKETCYHLRKSKFGISLDLAIKKGYEACKNCYSKKPEVN